MVDIDARAAIVGSALLLGPTLSLLSFYLPGWANGRAENLVQLWSYAVLGTILIIVGATLTRLQARL